MKQNLKTSNLNTFSHQFGTIPKPSFNMQQSIKWGATRNKQTIQEEQQIFSQISSVPRREAYSMCQDSQFSPRQDIESASSPFFTVNSSQFGESGQQQYQASQLQSSISDISNVASSIGNGRLSDMCLQFAPSKLFKEYKLEQQQKQLQQRARRQKIKEAGQTKLPATQLRNRLRSLRNWVDEGKKKKSTKCSHFKKPQSFNSLMTMTKKDKQEHNRKKQHLQYLKQHPSSKLAYYKQLLNQEGISYQQAKRLVEDYFPYIQKQIQELIFTRLITNDQISKNGQQLIRKLREGRLQKKQPKAEEPQMQTIGNNVEKQKKVMFEGIKCVQKQPTTIKQEESSSSNYQYEKQLRKLKKIYAETRDSYSKPKEDSQIQLNLQKQIHPKRTAKTYLKDVQTDEKTTKKVKLSQNYYCTSGMDSESDTRTTPWSKNQFKSLTKLNSQTILQTISEADQSIQEIFRQL